MHDPDYIRHEHQPRAKAGGEIGPNGEHYKGGAWIATKEDRPKGLQVTPEGEVTIDGQPVTPTMRRRVVAGLREMGFDAEYRKQVYRYSYLDCAGLFVGARRVDGEATTLDMLVRACVAEAEARAASWREVEAAAVEFGETVTAAGDDHSPCAIEVLHDGESYYFTDWREYLDRAPERRRRAEKRAVNAYVRERGVKVTTQEWVMGQEFYLYTGDRLPAPHGRLCRTAGEVYALTADELAAIAQDGKE
jgi:hypothetical protein